MWRGWAGGGGGVGLCVIDSEVFLGGFVLGDGGGAGGGGGSAGGSAPQRGAAPGVPPPRDGATLNSCGLVN